jgi:hypothetical protein
VGYADGSLGRFRIEPKLPFIGRMAARFELTGLVEAGDPEFDRMFLVRAPAPEHGLSHSDLRDTYWHRTCIHNPGPVRVFEKVWVNCCDPGLRIDNTD